MTNYIVKKTRGDADDIDINSDDVDITAQPTYTVDDLFKRSYGPTIYPNDIYAKGPWVDVRAFGASGSANQTTGSITAGEYELTLTDAKDFADGMGISVAGAGASGATLIATISSGGGTTILTLATAASTTVTSATVEHDDATAIQAGINACVSSGKTLIVPAGTYNIETALTVSGPLSMQGVGYNRAVIFYAPTDLIILTIGAGADYTQINNITFKGLSDTGTGLKLYDAKECIISDCVFDDLSIGAYLQTYNQGTWYNTFMNCTWRGNATGVRFDQAVGATLKPNRNRFIGCTWLTSTNYHVYIDEGDTEQFSKCDFGHAPVMLHAGDDNLSLVGCSLEGDASNTAVYLETTSDGTYYRFTDCSVSHGVWSLDDASRGVIAQRNAYNQYRRISLRLYHVYLDSEVLSSWRTDSGTDDAVARYILLANGAQEWGDGTNARDVFLSRESAGVMRVNNSLRVGAADEGWFQLNIQDYVTISGGEITPTGSYVKVETEGGAVLDELVTINPPTGTSSDYGKILIIQLYDDTHEITVKGDQTGNITLPGRDDITLAYNRDKIMLIFTNDGWVAVGGVTQIGAP